MLHVDKSLDYDQKEKLADKWCRIIKRYSQLKDYELVIKYLFSILITKGIRISFEPGWDECLYENDSDLLLEEILHICTEPRNNQLTVIWAMYHEYGHSLQEPPSPPEKIKHSGEKYAREKDAWDRTEQLLMKWDDFAEYIQDFYQYRDQQLSKHAPRT